MQYSNIKFMLLKLYGKKFEKIKARLCTFLWKGGALSVLLLFYFERNADCVDGYCELLCLQNK